MVSDSFDVFKVFADFDIDMELCNSGFQLALATNMLRNINDAIHARFAERHASRLVTFDSDFRKFAAHISIPIDILS
jgi:predicted nucleic acid-binding protein